MVTESRISITYPCLAISCQIRPLIASQGITGDVITMINWKVRIKNKAFWLALIPALLLLVANVAVIFGVRLDFSQLNEQLAAVIVALFNVLAILGIVNDPTTAGLSDSDLAMTYETPKPKHVAG